MTGDELLAVRAESLYETLGGDLCSCQNVDCPRLRGEGEQRGLKRADDIAHRVAADANPDETPTAFYAGINPRPPSEDSARAPGGRPEEENAALELFTELELAMYGKVGNTWERSKAERVMAVLRKAVSYSPASRAWREGVDLA